MKRGLLEDKQAALSKLKSSFFKIKKNSQKIWFLPDNRKKKTKPSTDDFSKVVVVNSTCQIVNSLKSALLKVFIKQN